MWLGEVPGSVGENGKKVPSPSGSGDCFPVSNSELRTPNPRTLYSFIFRTLCISRHSCIPSLMLTIVPLVFDMHIQFHAFPIVYKHIRLLAHAMKFGPMPSSRCRVPRLCSYRRPSSVSSVFSGLGPGGGVVGGSAGFLFFPSLLDPALT